MTTHRLKDNSIKAMILLGLMSVLSFKSCTLVAQSREMLDWAIYEKVKAWEDSVANEEKVVKADRPREHPLYLGFDLSFAAPYSRLSSRIDRMNGTRMTYFGGSTGGVLANDVTKLRANVGFYYSDASMPLTVETFQTSLSASLYLLRLTKIKYHTLEPYAVIGISQQFNKFYGTYLLNDGQPYNYSSEDQPLMGKTRLALLSAGGGIEYQLENDQHQFIHFFTEVNYGIPISLHASSKVFSGTKSLDQVCFRLGLSFGLVKG